MNHELEGINSKMKDSGLQPRSLTQGCTLFVLHLVLASTGSQVAGEAVLLILSL